MKRWFLNPIDENDEEPKTVVAIMVGEMKSEK